MSLGDEPRRGPELADSPLTPTLSPQARGEGARRHRDHDPAGCCPISFQLPPCISMM
jgi:hypothetical protein